MEEVENHEATINYRKECQEKTFDRERGIALVF
jgi:hypothetical protein